MALKDLLLTLALCWLTAGMPPPVLSLNTYQAISVQNLDSIVEGTASNGLVDMALAILPQIEEVFANITKNASPAVVKDAERFKGVLHLFVPFIRKVLEFRAEDQGRAVTPDELEMVDAVEIALQYLSDLDPAGLDVEGVQIPDYTDLLIPDYSDLIPEIPDFSIPSLTIPEQKLPSIKIPEINIPGGRDIPAQEISLGSIQGVNIPGRRISVTSSPVTRPPVAASPVTTPPVTSSLLTPSPARYNSTPSRSRTLIRKRPFFARRGPSATTERAPTTTESTTTVQPTTPTVLPIFIAPTFRTRRLSPSSILRQSMATGAGGGGRHPAFSPPKDVQHLERVVQSESATGPVSHHTLPGGGYFYRVHSK